MLISFSSAIGKGDYVSDILFFPGIFSRHFHANQTHFNHNSGVLLQAHIKNTGGYEVVTTQIQPEKMEVW